MLCSDLYLKTTTQSWLLAGEPRAEALAKSRHRGVGHGRWWESGLSGDAEKVDGPWAVREEEEPREDSKGFGLRNWMDGASVYRGGKGWEGKGGGLGKTRSLDVDMMVVMASSTRCRH